MIGPKGEARKVDMPTTTTETAAATVESGEPDQIETSKPDDNEKAATVKELRKR